MNRPKRYAVEYDDEAKYQAEVDYWRARDPECPEAHADPAKYRVTEEFDDLAGARAFAAGHNGWIMYERRNIRDVTPREDPPGLLWEWDEEWIEEQG